MFRKRIKRITSQHLFLLSMALISTIGLCCLHIKIFTISQIILSIDSLVADEECQKIESMIQHPQWHNCNRSTLDLFMRNLPYHQQITLVHLPGNKMHVTIDAQEPLYVINNDFVVTSHAQCIAKKIYAPHCTNNLFSISLYEEKVDLEKMVHVARQLPSCVYDAYNLVWQSSVDVWLYDQENKHYAIRFLADNVPNKKLIKLCHRIEDERGNHTPMVVDVRFADQIIVYENKGGIV